MLHPFFSFSTCARDALGYANPASCGGADVGIARGRVDLVRIFVPSVHQECRVRRFGAALSTYFAKSTYLLFRSFSLTFHFSSGSPPPLRAPPTKQRPRSKEHHWTVHEEGNPRSWRRGRCRSGTCSRSCLVRPVACAASCEASHILPTLR